LGWGTAGAALASIFLHEEALIHQTGHFIAILGLSAPMLGIINMVTSYFQALGAASRRNCFSGCLSCDVWKRFLSDARRRASLLPLIRINSK